MSLEQASLWLVGSILFTLGAVVLLIGLVFINNLIHRYWKPVTVFTKDSFTLFGTYNTADPMQNLTNEEYEKLVKHLEQLRNPEKIEPSLEGKDKK